MGGAIPKEFIGACEAGFEESMECGILAGYAMRDVKVTLLDGSYHEVDSSEMAFKIAASMAFKDGCREAGLGLLEPVMRVEVVLPEEQKISGKVLNPEGAPVAGAAIRAAALNAWIRLCAPGRFSQLRPISFQIKATASSLSTSTPWLARKSISSAMRDSSRIINHCPPL